MSSNILTVGTAVAEALRLGIFCRPVKRTASIGVGEALEVSPECFWMRTAYSAKGELHHVSPEDLVGAWELVTLDILREEWRKAAEEPW